MSFAVCHVPIRVMYQDTPKYDSSAQKGLQMSYESHYHTL